MKDDCVATENSISRGNGEHTLEHIFVPAVGWEVQFTQLGGR